LDGAGSCAANDRIIPKRLQRHTRLDLVQDRDLGEAVPNGDRRVFRHYETRMASRSMLSLISG
jgi:hypothetical protein